MGTAAGRLLKLLLEELMTDRPRERDEEVCYRGMTGRQVVLPENLATYTLTGGCVFCINENISAFLTLKNLFSPPVVQSKHSTFMHAHAELPFTDTSRDLPLITRIFPVPDCLKYVMNAKYCFCMDCLILYGFWWHIVFMHKKIKNNNKI